MGLDGRSGCPDTVAPPKAQKTLESWALREPGNWTYFEAGAGLFKANNSGVVPVWLSLFLRARPLD
jgi:hypothetical protein